MIEPSSRAAAVQTGSIAFAAEDWPTARAALETAAGLGAPDPAILAMLGVTCRELGDETAAHAAADAALAIDGQTLRAVLAKANLLADANALREATPYFNRALEMAARQPQSAPDILRGLDRARSMRRHLQAEMTEALRARLSAEGYRPGASNVRFTHALDLALGHRRPYVSEPRMFYYPELPSIDFFPRSQVPWLEAIEAATDGIADELNAVLAAPDAFEPYLQTRAGLPNLARNSLVDSLDWSSCYLQRDGVETTVAQRCPATMAALAQAPLCRIKGRSPHILFSQLRPAAHIPPHNGFLNTRLICHLPLIAPPGCQFRVGSSVRQWERGKGWAFDDTIEHEARNTGDQTRIILLFDVWRPELSEEERGLITALLETMASHAPRPESWE